MICHRQLPSGACIGSNCSLWIGKSSQGKCADNPDADMRVDPALAKPISNQVDKPWTDAGGTVYEYTTVPGSPADVAARGSASHKTATEYANPQVGDTLNPADWVGATVEYTAYRGMDVRERGVVDSIRDDGTLAIRAPNGGWVVRGVDSVKRVGAGDNLTMGGTFSAPIDRAALALGNSAVWIDGKVDLAASITALLVRIATPDPLDPDTLWLVQGAKVLGPWTNGERVTSDGTCMAQALPNSVGYEARCNGFGRAFVRDGRLDREVEAEAKAWCDEKLRKLGWALATGVSRENR